MRKILLTLIFLLSSLSLVFGAEYHGVVSVEDYYSSDSSSAYNFNFLTTRLRLDATKLNEAGNLSFHFDGRERNNLSTKDYNKTYIKNERIDTLNLEYLMTEQFYIAAGRLWPKELSAERVDGLNLVFQRANSGIGIFGGMKPDPYTEEFNSDYTSAGGYVYYRSDDTLANLAFAHNGYKGGTDRQYIYGQTSYSPYREVRFYGSITADMNQQTNNTDLTNAIFELSYRPIMGTGFTLGYNQFRSFKYYKSMNYDIVNTQQESYYVRGDYRFFNKYTLYGKYELQSLNYPAYKTELKKSNLYQFGFRADNLIGDMNMDVNSIIANSFSSSYNIYNIEFSKLFDDVFQMVVNSSYMENKYDFTGYTDT
ncbi:MAG: hypothetical protein HY097_00315, partial [Nitrospinae bacterium]|nr:hypothetical protein [Nitrospinota bacterium]